MVRAQDHMAMWMSGMVTHGGGVDGVRWMMGTWTRWCTRRVRQDVAGTIDEEMLRKDEEIRDNLRVTFFFFLMFVEVQRKET